MLSLFFGACREVTMRLANSLAAVGASLEHLELRFWKAPPDDCPLRRP